MSSPESVLDLFSNSSHEVGFVSSTDLERYQVVTIYTEGDLVGAALVEPLDDKYALVHAMAVAEVVRGSGIGRQLLRKVAASVSASRLQAKCRVGLSANGFYQTTGWTLDRQTGDGNMNVWEYTL